VQGGAKVIFDQPVSLISVYYACVLLLCILLLLLPDVNTPFCSFYTSTSQTDGRADDFAIATLRSV